MKGIPKKYGGVSFSCRGSCTWRKSQAACARHFRKKIFPIDYDKSTLIIEHFKYNFKFNFDDVSG